jgi:hypothetical protein
MAPHSHDIKKTGSIIGSTVIDPKKNWPNNFWEDPEAPGCGVWTCEKCNGTGQDHEALKKPYSDDECRHDKRFERLGLLTCQDCGWVYNENTLSWEPNRDNND